MHFSTTLTVLSGLALATTSVAYDTISFTTWNCTACTPVEGQFCSVNKRDNLPIKDQCIQMWNQTITMKTYDPTLPSCQGKGTQRFTDGNELIMHIVNLYPGYACDGIPQVHKYNGGRCEGKIASNSYKITC
jgi:hypothetical protein